jgi:hypothetical protein
MTMPFDRTFNPETDGHTLLRLPKDTPDSYWGGWAEVDQGLTEQSTKHVILRTVRTGSTGESDAQYILDRAASGLYFGSLV